MTFTLLKSVISLQLLFYLGPVSSIQQFLNPGFHLVLRHCSPLRFQKLTHSSFTVDACVPGAHCVDQAGLETTGTRLPLAPEFRVSRLMPACLASCFFSTLDHGKKAGGLLPGGLFILDGLCLQISSVSLLPPQAVSFSLTTARTISTSISNLCESRSGFHL